MTALWSEDVGTVKLKHQQHLNSTPLSHHIRSHYEVVAIMLRVLEGAVHCILAQG